MADRAEELGVLFAKTEQYAVSTFELYKLKSIARSADVASLVTARIAVGAFAILVFLFLNIGVALWLGDAMGKAYLGFFAVAGIDTVIAVLLTVFRNKWIINPMKNAIVNAAIK